MSKTSLFKNLDLLSLARWLLILELIALLFSPPLTNLFELTLFALFISSSILRQRFVLASKQPIVIATLLFYSLILIDTSYSIETWQASLSAFWGWRKIMLLPIAVALFDEEIWKQKLILVFVKVAVVCVSLSYISKIFQFNIHHSYPIGIIIRNHATQGIMFSAAAFAIAMLLISNPKLFTKTQKWIYAACIMLLTSNVIYLTPGRSGYLALIVLALTTAFAYAYQNKKLLIPLMILTILPILLLSSANVKQRVSQAVNEAEFYKSNAEATAMGIRMVLWNNTIELIRERPLFGYGTGGFQKAYKAKVENSPLWKQDITHDPHNQFLKITTEQGFVGLLFFIGMILSFFWQKVQFNYRLLGIGILLVWCGNSQFSSHFSTFSEGRFLYLWGGVMLASTNASSKKSTT